MEMFLADSHCHLTDAPLREDLPGVLARAARAGVKWLLVPGYDLCSSRAACRLAARHAELRAAVGLHPAWLKPSLAFSPETLRQLARLRQPAAIGEIGLDFALADFSQSRQLEALEQQLELAALLDLPVILHCRRAFEPLYAVLRNFPKNRGVLHAYGGGPQLAEKFLALGFYLGFGGNLTRPLARRVREAALLAPPERILLETDAPYIGSRGVVKGASEPRDLPAVALALAALRNWDPLAVAAWTTANFFRLFGVDEGKEK
ncbi:MAG TPA: TatD family deoxyribonuclease [Proteobacteria bacterium]|nr:TatD family deoxyribonuclease [Pseudomonadota bacterium]